MSEDENEELETVSEEISDGADEQKNSEADWDDALNEQEGSEKLASAEFEEFDKPGETVALNSSVSSDLLKLDVILDVPVTVSMEIGRTQINIRNLLQLNQGSVIELDRFAGEPMDVLVNGTLIAHGEVVVVNEKFGIRLTDVISPTERVKKLG